MVEVSATSIQALRFGTSAAADPLGIGDESWDAGAREEGGTGDPLQDIKALREVRLVVRGGFKVRSPDEAGVSRRRRRPSITGPIFDLAHTAPSPSLTPPRA